MLSQINAVSIVEIFPMIKPVIFSPQIKAHKIVYVIEYAIRCHLFYNS